MIGHMATILQLPSFLGASSVERMFNQRCLVFNMECVKKKNLLPTNRKVRKKNQIPKYYAFSSEETIMKIQDGSTKNLLTQWDTEEENRKILTVFGEKPPNLDGRWRRKTGKDQAIKRSKTSLPTWWWWWWT